MHLLNFRKLEYTRREKVKLKRHYMRTYVPLTPPPLPERGWSQAGGEGELPFNSRKRTHVPLTPEREHMSL